MRNIYDRRAAGEVSTHVHGAATLEGFRPDQACAMQDTVQAVMWGLDAIFPPGHHRFTIERATVAGAFAQTTTYGRESVMELDLAKHVHPVTREIDTEALARIAQTLTHEIVLHARKMHEEYFLANHSALDRPADDDHRDACVAGAREEYEEAMRRVAVRLPDDQRAIFAQAWHDEIVDVARECLAVDACAEAVRWAGLGRARIAAGPAEAGG